MPFLDCSPALYWRCCRSQRGIFNPSHGCWFGRWWAVAFSPGSSYPLRLNLKGLLLRCRERLCFWCQSSYCVTPFMSEVQNSPSQCTANRGFYVS
jgi:hypothetical protein